MKTSSNSPTAGGFDAQLQAAKGDLTAKQVAAAVSPALSHRTVEDWLADRRSPPEWTHEWILSRVRSPKRPRKAKGQNDQSLARRASDSE
jgi:hypothetical protein